MPYPKKTYPTPAADAARESAFEQICRAPHTLMAYTTTSGQGLRVLFRYSDVFFTLHYDSPQPSSDSAVTPR